MSHNWKNYEQLTSEKHVEAFVIFFLEFQYQWGGQPKNLPVHLGIMWGCDWDGLWHWEFATLAERESLTDDHPLGCFSADLRENGTGLAIAIPKKMPQTGVSRDDSYI